MKILKVVNSLMKKQMFFVLLSLLTGVLTILSNIGLLSASAVLISKAALHPEVLDLMVLIVAVRFFGVSRGVFRYLERIFSHDTTFRILSRIRQWFFKSFNENYSENNKFKTGDIYTKIVNNVDELKDFYLRGIYPFIIAIFTGIITSIFISYFSKEISCIYAAGYILVGFILPIIILKLNNSFLEKENNLKKDINIVLLNILKGILELNIYSLKEKLTKEFKDLSRELSKLQKKKASINIFGDNLYSLVSTSLMAISLVLAAPMLAENKLSAIYYAMLPLTIMASFEALMPMIAVVYKFDEIYNCSKSISSIIEGDNDKVKHFEESINNYNISVKNLSILDDNSKRYIIKNLSFELPYKKKIAIVGASGSGKSTILKALLGFIKYQEGDIKIGGKSYKNLSMEEIRKLFTAIEQNPYVFNTTIRENLLIANTEADENAIVSLLKELQVINLTKELSDGLDTMLGQFGYNVSGGEKQRLMIARALLKPSKIIFLDEPTASLDIKLEKKVVEVLHSAVRNKSCIWVTHRLVAMDKMDEIIVLHKGEVVERGGHRELIDKKGRYFKFWSAQNQYLKV